MSKNTLTFLAPKSGEILVKNHTQKDAVLTNCYGKFLIKNIVGQKTFVAEFETLEILNINDKDQIDIVCLS